MTSARILVVDDEASTRSALAELLREEGYVIETAPDGSKAESMLERFAPDLVLTDLSMPNQDGLELLRSVKARTPHLPVVVMTAFGEAASAVTAMREGASDYLTKPLDIEKLCSLLSRILSRGSARRA